MGALGKRLLIGRGAPFDPQKGLSLLSRAVQCGDAEATSQMATLHAAGAWIPQDWPQAFNFLLQAAELGLRTAQEQLLILVREQQSPDCSDVRESDSPAIWRCMRDLIDLSWWRTAPARRVLLEAPRIRASESFVSPAVCNWFIERTRGKLKPAAMYDGRRTRFTTDRTNSDFIFDIVEADLVLLLVREKISALTRLPAFAMEPPQILHYAPGQELKPHYDHVGSADSYQGERIATFLLYLNDDYEGGELEFPKVGIQHRGRRGDAVFFANVDHAGVPDSLTLHAGRPVLAGEKWLFSQWIHDRTFSAANAGSRA